MGRVTTPTPNGRGCGSRRGGGYVCCGVGAGGTPIEFFFYDDPLDLPEGFIIPTQGVILHEVEGITHIIDWIGEENYPNVTDWIEEVRRFGMSQRVEGIDYSRLTRESRLIGVHKRAKVNRTLQELTELFPEWDCPSPYRKTQRRHQRNNFQEHAANSFCLGKVWEMGVGVETLATPVIDTFYSFGSKLFTGKREMPSFSYYINPISAHVSQEALDESFYRPAFFISLPITTIEIVKDVNAPAKDAERLEAASKSGLDVVLTED